MSRYYLIHKSRKLTTEGPYVESTYVPKPRYHHNPKPRKLVRWLAYITSDWRRLVLATLILVSACGLGTVAVLNLLGLSQVSQTAEPTIITPPHQILSKRPESDASAERSTLAEKKNNDRGGPQIDDIENSSRLRDVKSGPKSSDRVDRVPSEEAITTRQKPQEDLRPAQSFKSSSVSSKSIPSTKGVGDDQEFPSGAKAPSHMVQKSSSTKTQRPRRVTGRDDRMAPAATSGRNMKAKVIQWP